MWWQGASDTQKDLYVWDSDLSYLDLSDYDFAASDLGDADLTGTDLRGADLSRSKCSGNVRADGILIDVRTKLNGHIYGVLSPEIRDLYDTWQAYNTSERKLASQHPDLKIRVQSAGPWRTAALNQELTDWPGKTIYHDDKLIGYTAYGEKETTEKGLYLPSRMWLSPRLNKDIRNIDMGDDTVLRALESGLPLIIEYHTQGALQSRRMWPARTAFSPIDSQLKSIIDDHKIYPHPNTSAELLKNAGYKEGQFNELPSRVVSNQEKFTMIWHQNSEEYMRAVLQDGKTIITLTDGGEVIHEGEQTLHKYTRKQPRDCLETGYTEFLKGKATLRVRETRDSQGRLHSPDDYFPSRYIEEPLNPGEYLRLKDEREVQAPTFTHLNRGHYQLRTQWHKHGELIRETIEQYKHDD
jgi:hypothetical protein